MTLRIVGTLNGLDQIVFIIEKVHDQLLKKLLQIDKETLSIAQLLHNYCQIEPNAASEIVKLLKKEDIILIDQGHEIKELKKVIF